MRELIHCHGWTFIPTAREVDNLWRGVVVVRRDDRRGEHLCFKYHASYADALNDAMEDASDIVVLLRLAIESRRLPAST